MFDLFLVPLLRGKICEFWKEMRGADQKFGLSGWREREGIVWGFLYPMYGVFCFLKYSLSKTKLGAGNLENA